MNFDNFLITIHYLLKIKKASYTKAFSFICIGSLLFYFNLLFKVEATFEYFEDLHTDVVERLLTPFIFLSIEALITQSLQSYIILLILSVSIPILIIILFLILWFQIQTKGDRTTFLMKLAQIFVHIQEAYQWILIFPIVYIQSTYLFNFEQIDQKLQISINLNSYFIIILEICSILGFILNIIIIIFQQTVFYNYKLKLDFLSFNNNDSLTYFRLQHIVMGIVYNIKFQFVNNNVIFFIAQVLFSLLTLQQLYSGDLFLILFQAKIQRLYVLTSLLYVSITISMIYTYLAYFMNLSNQEYTLIITLIVQAFFILTYKKVVLTKLSNLIIKNSHDTKDIVRKVFFLQELINDMNEMKELFYFGVIVHHLNRSHNHSDWKNIGMRCYCQQKVIYNAKKDNDVTKSLHSVKKHKKLYTKLEIKSLYEQYLISQSNDIEIHILYIRFLVFNMNLKSLAISQINNLLKNQYKINYLQKFRLRLIIYQIKIMIQDQNTSSYNGQLDFERTLEMESTVQQIKVYIQDILNLKIQFWKHLLRNQINQDILIQYDDLINNNISQCNSLWDLIINSETRIRDKIIKISYLDRRIKWQLYYSWYCIHILNQKVKSNQFFESTSYEEFVYEDSESDDDKYVFNKYSKDKSFNKSSIILHTDLNGNILKQSQSCQELTGYYTLNNVYQLIPQSMIRNHQIQLLIFKSQSRSNTLYKRKKVYFQHQQNYIIPANKYLKLECNRFNQLEFICMIRPLIRLQQQNYLILNEDWEIDSMTLQLMPLLLPKICVFIICPQLLNFTKYQRYINEEDLSIFNLSFKNVPQQKDEESLKQKEREKIKEELEDICVLNSQNYFEFKDFFNKTADQGQFTSNLQIIDDELIRIEHSNFQKIVNVEHTQILLRIPKNIEDLVEEYHKSKLEILSDFQLKKSMMYLNLQRHLIVKDKFGQLKINQPELLKRIYSLQEEYHQSQYQILKKLYIKYCYRKRNLNKIIKVDGSIKFSRRTLMDKNVVIKFNRFEIYEDNFRSNIYNSLALKQRASIKQVQNNVNTMNQIQMQLNQSYSQYIDESFRINQSKSLITYEQITGDFYNQNQQINLSLNVEENIFLKDDQNKCSVVSLNEFVQFKLYSRLLLLQILLSYIMICIFADSENSKLLFDQNISQLNLFFTIQLSILKVYNAFIDVSLFNNYQIKDLDLEFVNLNNNQFYDHYKLVVKEQLNLIKNTYQSQSYIHCFYNIDIHQSNNQSIIDIYNSYIVNLILFQQEQFTETNSSLKQLNQFREIVYPYLIESLSQIILEITKNLELLQVQQYFFRIITITYHTVFSIIIVIINILIVFKLINKQNFVQQQIFEIEKDTVSKVNQYYSGLRYQFIHCFETKNLPLKPLSNSINHQIFHQSDTETSKTNNKSTKHQRSLLNSKIQQRLKYVLTGQYLMLQPVLVLQLIIINIIALIELSEMKDRFDNQNFFLNSQMFQSMTLIKEIYIVDNEILSENFINTEYFQNRLSFIYDQLEEKDIEFTNYVEENTILKGNICQNEIFISQEQLCSDYLNGALRHGLNFYFKLVSQMILVTLNTKETRFNKLNLQDINYYQLFQNEIFDSSTLAVNTWNQSIIQEYFEFLDLEIIVMICFLSIIGFYHFLFFELQYFQKLKIQFSKINQFYNRYIPNETLLKQKIMRSQFLRRGIIKK
ncbi:unnamed protein product [Paramecium pentaurelia]|uniref:Transmembrane protein n=1 Tax=Paramecium pentaurelia TaxID=43138 RepID=A0A8S1VMP9_9CILI|nr:unnamed protein product [Paramecium pentaurelia]